ncbi:MAG TPA: hypothetical protein VFD82_21800 [Planctomycetota bacterium]|nr:hypothetical protein [Planctomycetota bacterium]
MASIPTTCRRLVAALALLAIACPAQTQLREFRNRALTFRIDLPANWRQLAPSEALRIGENPKAPAELGLSQPGGYYAVGPVDEWLAGVFTSPWVQVVEQDKEWHLGDDFAAQLAEQWRKTGAATGVEYELRDIRRDKVGAQAREVLTARRTSTPKPPRLPHASLDVHAPAGVQEVTLSFTCPVAEYARWDPEFHRWLQTLAFAHAARGEQKLSDRLWTPILSGAVVGLVLLLLYKHTRRRG